MTIAEWIRHAESRLQAAGIDSPRLEAQVLAAHVLRVDRSWLLAHPEREFNDLAGETLVQRRERHEPLAYITGTREFFGRPFRVTPAVLIPRHETETLIETAISGPATTVLDIGTGSGCIAITLKLERPEWDVTAIDVSPAALGVAQENAATLNANVRFALSDGFTELLGEAFDLIVSNPPYIGRTEPLPRDVAEHEPALALFSGETGLEFYERLAREAPDHLNDGGRLMMEVGYQQAQAVRELFERHGWHHIETVPDLTGVDRVVVVGYAHACAVHNP